MADTGFRIDAAAYGLSAESLDKAAALARASAGSSAAKGSTAGSARTEPEARELLRALDQALAALPPDPPGVPMSAARGDWARLWDGAASRGRMIEEARALRRRVELRSEELRRELGEDGLRQQMSKGAVLIEDGSGQAKMTLIDGHPFVRVLHKASGLSVLLLDADSISKDSAHLRRVVARQLFDGGGRGRSSVVVWERRGEVLSTEAVSRPSPASLAWWKQYWRATYQRPSRADVKLAVGMSLVQGALALALGGLKSALGSPAASWTAFAAPVVFTMAFGFGVGSYIVTYKNWVFRGRWLSQMAKAALISTAFAYPVLLITQGWAAVGTWLVHAHVLYNVFLNNLGGVVWRQIPRLAERHRLYAGAYVWGVKKENLFFNLNYLINWTLRLGDLLHVPGGLALFLASIPGAVVATYAFARWHALPEAREMRAAPGRLLRRLAAAISRRRA